MPVTLHRLPARVPYTDRAGLVQRCDGVIPAGKLSRLAAVGTGGGDVRVSLWTECGADGSTRLVGRLAGRLLLRCERCLRPCEWVFDLPVALRVVRSEAEERRLLASCEPLLVEGDWLALHALVEDEILLALPIALVHVGGCPGIG